MSKARHLVVVDADADIRAMLRGYFEGQGAKVTEMASAEELLARLPTPRPDLLVLDVNLPGMSGFDLCRKLRERGDRVPIVFVTAQSEDIDCVVGLELGADDFVGKPFSARVLMARINSVIRRTEMTRSHGTGSRSICQVGIATFDIDARSLVSNGSTRVLTGVEFSVLAELVGSSGVPVSRGRLWEVSNRSVDGRRLRAVDVAVSRIRKLVEPKPSSPTYIRTVRDIGYVFVP